MNGTDILGCFGALISVIDEFSSVGTLSECFTSDVLQFLQSKRSLKENHVLPVESPSVTFTEIRCFIQSMSLDLYSQQTELDFRKLIARADMKFMCDVPLKNDQLVCLYMSFTSLTLSSLFSSVVLVEGTSSSQNA
ncbi:hypothetical protein Tco_0323758 [Tanacetum coccineum]